MIKCSVHGIDNIQLYQYLIESSAASESAQALCDILSDIKFVMKQQELLEIHLSHF